MKKQLFMIALLGFLALHLNAQRKWSGEVYVNPYVQRLGQSHIEQEGLNLYDFNERKKWQKEIGIKFIREIHGNLRAGVGVGVKDIYYDVGATISGFPNPSEVLQSVGGDVKLILIAPSIFFEYEFQNLSVQAGTELNFVAYETASFERIENQSVTVISEQGSSGSISISQFSDFHTIPMFFVPEFRMSYEVLPDLRFHLGTKMKLSGCGYYYYLTVDGYTTSIPTGEIQTLQRTMINPKMIMPYFGVSYRFAL